MGAKFYASYTGIGELIRSPQMEKAMLNHARRIKERAEATAPVGDPGKDPHAGRYKASFQVESGQAGGFKKDRAYGRVLNTAPEAFYIEYGSSRIEARHTLLSAAQAVKD